MQEKSLSIFSRFILTIFCLQPKCAWNRLCCPVLAWRPDVFARRITFITSTRQKITSRWRLLKTGLNNVVLPALFNVVNNIVQHCYTGLRAWFRLNNVFNIVDNIEQCRQHNILQSCFQQPSTTLPSMYTRKNAQPVEGWWKQPWTMLCCPHCSMLSTILFSTVTLDCGLIHARQCWTILLTTLNNVRIWLCSLFYFLYFI